MTGRAVLVLLLSSLVLFSRNGSMHVKAKENNTTEPTCKDDDNADTSNTVQEHLECGLYVAESSIPNAGWGMYTAKPLKKGQQIGPQDVSCQVSDFKAHMTSRADPIPCRLMKDYSWRPRFGGASYEAKDVDTIVPGLGMLANSHTGLVNAETMGSRVQHGPGDRNKPETGAYSYHSHLYETNQDLPAGMELFVMYGDKWFADRSNIFGKDMPLSQDFVKADIYLKNFFNAGGNNENLYGKWRQAVATSDKIGPRIQRAIPWEYKDARHVMEKLNGSTAMYSVPDVVRPLEWLQQNGLCLDHMKMGESTIEGAGKGAFASRNLPRGTIVSPAPVLHLHRGHLEVLLTNPDNKREVFYKGQQLLLNYVYGHPSSSLLFYPYATATNLINHGSGSKTNVKVRWSSRQTHPEWLGWTPDQLLQQDSTTGLMMEFVATRDIQEGEEILVDYGKDWEEAWNKHVEEWEPPANADTYTPAYELIKKEVVIRTVDEEPYPSNILTACWLGEIEDPVEGSDVYKWLETDQVKSVMDYYGYTDETFHCDILERSDSNTYTALYKWLGDNDEVVHTKVGGIPQRAIILVERPYTADSYLPNAFRHYLELPDEMIPKPWRDLETKEMPKAQ